MIATCKDWPNGNADLQALSLAFNQRGVDCQLQPWQKILNNRILPQYILPLAVWDYSVNPSAYQAFLVRALVKGIKLINSADLQHWNINKHYLADLEQAGLPVIPSLYLEIDKAKAWTDIISQCDWQNPVIKPLIGQSGKGVRRLDGQIPTRTEYKKGAIVQPFIDSITEQGELCLIYIDGKFSHAIRRTPTDWRANSAHGVEISPITAKEDWLKVAEKALLALPQLPVYTRIDGLIDANQQFILNEVELIEPALYLSQDKDSLTRFVDDICGYLN